MVSNVLLVTQESGTGFSPSVLEGVKVSDDTFAIG